MSAPAVTRLDADDAQLVRDLRLELLNAYPENFAADPEFEGALSLDQWRERLSSDARCWFVCRIDGEVAGMIVFSRVTHTKKRLHMGDIGSMYVRAKFHGSGAADALMNAALNVAQNLVEQIELTVNAENARAIAFYKRHGFREHGCAPRALKVGERYYDEVAMSRAISAGDR
jgi:ribosomal protein S18 acetylase RimI-like enzyme